MVQEIDFHIRRQQIWSFSLNVKYILIKMIIASNTAATGDQKKNIKNSPVPCVKAKLRFYRKSSPNLVVVASLNDDCLI